MSAAHANSPGNSSQFSLLALFEYTTICCILASLNGFIGMTSTLCLMLFALGLFLRIGWLAVAMLSAAFIVSVFNTEATTFLRELALAHTAGFICLWYIYRRNALSPSF